MTVLVVRLSPSIAMIDSVVTSVMTTLGVESVGKLGNQPLVSVRYRVTLPIGAARRSRMESWESAGLVTDDVRSTTHTPARKPGLSCALVETCAVEAQLRRSP